MKYQAIFVIVAALVAFGSADLSQHPHPHVPIHSAPLHSAPIHSAPLHSAPIHSAPSHHPHPPVRVHSAPAPHNQVGYGYEEPVYANTPAHYNYEYAVHDDYAGTNFGHSEARDGYRADGTYYVHLPDGRVQTVNYYADETGYHPTVSYEGTASYGAPAAAYHTPEVGYH